MHDGDAITPNLIVVVLHVHLEEDQVAAKSRSIHIFRALDFRQSHFCISFALNFTLGCTGFYLGNHTDFNQAKK